MSSNHIYYEILIKTILPLYIDSSNFNLIYIYLILF